MSSCISEHCCLPEDEPALVPSIELNIPIAGCVDALAPRRSICEDIWLNKSIELGFVAEYGTKLADSDPMR